MLERLGPLLVGLCCVACTTVVVSDDDDQGDDATSTAGETTGEATSTAGETTGEADPDAEPAPGMPGGVCLAPDGMCTQGQCNRDENFCFDPQMPCRAFTCGGADRGTCTPVDGQPACVCNDGFENETFRLYCCPLDGGDPDCP